MPGETRMLGPVDQCIQLPDAITRGLEQCVSAYEDSAAARS